VYRKHASGGLQSTGWYNVAKIPPFGTHGRVTVSLGGDFTADIVTIEWISSVDTALNNSVSQPKLTARGTFAQATSPRITNTRIARDASTGGYFVQVYLSSGLNANTNGKSVLEVHMGEYVENNNSVNVAAMFNLFSGTTSHDWSCAITPNGTTKLGIHTKPEQPAFWVRRSSDQAGYNGNDYTQSVVFNYKIYDTGNNFSTSTGLFTAPVTGVYLFWGGVYATSGSAISQMWLTYNGGRNPGTDWTRNNNAQFINMTAHVKMNAGDTVGLHPYGSIGNIIANEYHTWFKGILVG